MREKPSVRESPKPSKQKTPSKQKPPTVPLGSKATTAPLLPTPTTPLPSHTQQISPTENSPSPLLNPPLVASYKTTFTSVVFNHETAAKTPQNTPPSYRNILSSSSKNLSLCLTASTTPPASFNDEKEIFILIDESEYAMLCSDWDCAVISKPYGKSFSTDFYIESLQKTWKPKANISSFPLGKGFFVTKFSSQEDFDRVLNFGPWFINGSFVSTSRWTPGFKPSQATAKKAVVWVELPELPTEFHSSGFLTKIGNSLGKFIKLDASKGRNKLRVARILVLIDESQVRKDCIWLGKIKQQLIYRDTITSTHQQTSAPSSEKSSTPSTSEPTSTQNLPFQQLLLRNGWLFPNPRKNSQRLQVSSEVCRLFGSSLIKCPLALPPIPFLLTGDWTFNGSNPSLSLGSPCSSLLTPLLSFFPSPNSGKNGKRKPKQQESFLLSLGDQPTHLNHEKPQSSHRGSHCVEEHHNLNQTSIQCAGDDVQPPILLYEGYSRKLALPHTGSDPRHSPRAGESASDVPESGRRGPGRPRKTHPSSLPISSGRYSDERTAGYPPKMVDSAVAAELHTNGDAVGAAICVGPSTRASARKKGVINYKRMATGAAPFGNKQCQVDSASERGDSNSIALCDHNPEIVILTKTKVHKSGVEDIIENLPFNSYEVVDLVGLSGGILILWNSGVNNIITVSKQPRVIHVVIQVNNKNTFFLSAIYASTCFKSKLDMWDDLIALTQNITYPWLLCGDFNEICEAHKKWGGNPQPIAQMRAYKDTMNQCNLIDLGYTGHKFTWFNKRKAQPIFERLDRFWASPDWIQDYPDALVQNLLRMSSDHNPILLTLEKWVFSTGHKLFRFEPMWFSDPDFDPFVIQEWTSIEAHLLEKLQPFTESISKWAQNSFGSVQNNIKRTWARIKGAQKALEADPSSSFLFELEISLNKDLKLLLEQEEMYWVARARTDWLDSGDRNTKFFHLSSTIRKNRNIISALKSEVGNWITEPEQLKNHIISYFTNLFSSENIELPESPVSSQALDCSSMPTMLELKNAVFSHIWKRRNDWIFSKINSPISFTVRQCSWVASEYFYSRNNPESQKPLPIAWSPPPPPLLEINCDASFLPDTLQTGCVVVCRNTLGEWVEGFTWKGYAPSSHDAELKAIQLSLQWIKERGWKNAMLCLDAKRAVDEIKHDQNSANNSNCITNCRDLLQELHPLAMHFEHRSTNGVADILAKEAKCLLGVLNEKFILINPPLSVSYNLLKMVIMKLVVMLPILLVMYWLQTMPL
uniref:RNase H type-1 domain-containing protein n=1 Tax=Chenopodium quinoa TaxID=63459 RepID=A0A803MV36_CHEQI